MTFLERPLKNFIFSNSGFDNGKTSIIDNHFDWHAMFVGQYDVGDIMWRGLISANNAHNMYWKISKNFADGVSHHIKDSLMLNSPTDGVYGILHSFLPGKHHTFRMKNVTFAGSGTFEKKTFFNFKFNFKFLNC